MTELNLNAIRERIDVLDHTLAETLQARFDLVMQVAQYKKARGLVVKDHSREAQVIEKVVSYLTDHRYDGAMKTIMQTIMDSACELEQTWIHSNDAEDNRFGLLGGKLGHSLSPRIHDLFFKLTNKKGTYELLERSSDTVSDTLTALPGRYRGINVTIPHKLAVMASLADMSAEARAIGAVNTIEVTPKGLIGHNTDYFGFARMLSYHHIEVSHRTIAVLGTGGAARAVVKYLSDHGAKTIYLVSRDCSRIDSEWLSLAPQIVTIDYESLATLQGDLLINCTPVGMYPHIEDSPVSASVSARFSASVDLIYNPSRTRFLQQAQLAGKKAVNGLFMLVAQAVAAQEIWQQEHYDSELIVRIMRTLEKEL